MLRPLGRLLIIFAICAQALVAWAALPAHNPPGERVLFLAPHPDDDVLYSGALLRALRAGADVTVIYLSDGESSDGMAKSYLERELPKADVPRTAPERIVLFEEMRRQEARDGIAALERATGRKASLRFLGLRNISQAAADPYDSSEAIRALETELRKPGSATVYVPHPRDTNPGHQGTNRLYARALETVPTARRVFTNTYGYVVHYGAYAGTLGIQPPDPAVEPKPLTFAYDTSLLESLPVTDENAVLKLEAILAHHTQVSRDDVLATGSPLTTGYLAGFATVPEIFERLPTSPTAMPKVRPSLARRGAEMVHRYVSPRFGAYDPARVEAAVERLRAAAEKVLPENSRARAALADARLAPIVLYARSFCQRVLLGPWAVKP